ncbi:OmpA family protein [Flavobacterium sp.]|uniref:OmpA family protein n=1 Tax=Flavobacterium sp. TaxID=239 RepID=UPI0026131380|nr:OmpA family protein [Flavobacterium sp.]MDD2986306.1 OmpA family protein [Flavobacterium sp.]
MKIILCFLLFCTSLFAQEKVELFFDFNHNEPNSQSKSIIKQWMKENPTAEVYQIEGYCDTVDTQSYNLKLAERRIKAVESILNQNKIKISDSIRIIPFGEVFDFSSNQAENRKVVFFYHINLNEVSFSDKMKKATVGELLNLKGMNFYNMSEVMLPESLPILEELLQIMRANPQLKIEIQGHICCNPLEVQDISTKRAKTVYDFLVANGIDTERMKYKGFASSRPIYPLPEKNEAERIANRRVELRILEK